MNSDKKRGFTLVELLVTIALLGIVGTIIVYNMMNISSTVKEEDYERFIAKVITSAETYASTNPEAFKDLYISKSYLYIKMEDLINSGKIEEDLKNPYTDETIKPDELIKANLNTVNGALTFEYPVTSKEEENFLVAMSDYVVYGEPYDCMQGAGTYQLALSEENGDLILLSDQSVIDEYHFTCEYPSEFASYDSSYPSEYRNGKYTDKPGTYNITYNWITKSGTPKSQTRVLRVLSKAKPTFIIKEVVNDTATIYDYNFDSKAYYTPSYTSSNGWKYLTYTAYIEGADPETTVYSVKKIALDQYNDDDVPKKGAIEENVVTNSSDFVTSYPVDDGVKKYSINAKVRGHYNKSYSYQADNSVVIRSKLIIPDDYVTTDSSSWSTNRSITVKSGIYSPVGIAYYEYRLSNSVPSNTVGIESEYTFNDRYISAASTNTPLFNNNRVKENALKDLSILSSSSCKDSLTEFETLYVRAINDDQYVGDWKAVNINLTNDIKRLLLEDSNCHKSSSSNCYYTEKKAYLDYGGNRFVILENYGDGKILVTKDGVGNNVTPIEIKKGNISVATPELMAYADINYRTPVVERVIEGADMGIPNINKHAIYNSWPISLMNVVNNATESKWGETSNYTIRTTTSSYSSFYGSATNEHVDKYKNAMLESSRYWTTDMFNESASVTATDEDGEHSVDTSYYNVYLYYVENGQAKSAYIGDTMPVKPMILFNNLNICSTTIDNYGNITYKVALN